MSPGCEQRSGSAADVDHGVVNGISDGADVFFGSAGRGADDARLYQRDAECGKDEDEANKQTERYGIAYRRQPGRTDGADQKIGGGENEICHRKRAAKAEAIGGGATEDGEKPYHAAEDAGQGSGLLGGEVQALLQVQGKRSESAVVRKALEDLADIRDPEGTLEAGADLMQAFGKTQDWFPW
jgi:hypothetical protein